MMLHSVRSLLVLALLVFPAAIASPAAAGTGGSLHPLAADSCLVAFTPPAGSPCVLGRGMWEFYPELAISPDGRHVYTTNTGGSAVTVHDRDPVTGGLKQKAGAAGCFYDANDTTDVPAGCTALANVALQGASNAVVSADGRHVYVAADIDFAVATFSRNLDTGVLTYAGCVSQTGGLGCSAGRRLDYVFELAIAPDGNHVYAAARGTSNQGSVVTLKRDIGTGLLTMDAGAAHCLSISTASTCTADATIRFPREIIVTPNNEHVYVADATGQVVGYNRNQFTGVLTAIPRPSGGCIAAAATSGCVVHPPIGNAPENLALSPDSTKLYVTSYWDGELHTLARAADGTLTPIPGACLTEAADADCPRSAPGLKTAYGLTAVDRNIYVAINDFNGGGSSGSVLTFDVDADGIPQVKPVPFGCVHNSLALCTTVRGMTGMLDVIASPDSKHVYGYGLGTLIGTARDAGPSCTPASATVEAGKPVTVQLNCTDPEGDAIAYEIVSPPASGVLGEPNAAGQVSYAAAADAGGRTIEFSYVANAFGGRSDAATATVAVTAPPPPPPAPTPVPTATPTPRITSGVSHLWRASARSSKVTSMVISDVPAGATITLRCAVKGKGKKCPFKKLTKKVTKAGKVNFLPVIKKRKRTFKVGTKLTLLITAPGHIGKSVVFTIRKNKVPSRTLGCTLPGSTKILKLC